MTGAGLRSEEFVLNMGPQHPSTHGVLRFVLKGDGEVIDDVIPDVGYLHRSIEKIGEAVPYLEFVPYTDRVDYIAGMNSNLAYCVAAEKLAGVEVPRRAEFLRVITCELNRISSHLISVGAMGMDVGATTPFLLAVRDREKINDLLEMVCGARLTYSYIWIGGVSLDAPQAFLDGTREFLEYYEPKWHEFNQLLTENKIFRGRLGGVGAITADDAVSFGLVGPNLRACGVRWDLRKDDPYSVYPDLEFDVPVGSGEAGSLGDSFDRYIVRVREIVESMRIIRQCLDRIEPGETRAKMRKKLKPPVGEVYVRTEAPRGEMGYYLVSDGSDKAYRCKIRTGSFSAMNAVPHISRGSMVADLVAIIASLDVVAPEIDR